jgi:hypothetical protein
MPLVYSRYRTPAGRTVLRLTSTGEVNRDHAAAFQQRTLPGGQDHGLALLIIVDRTTAISTEVRRIFTAQSEATGPRPPAALVTSNGTLRVLLNFMTRVSGGEANTRFFQTEAEAEKWLDQQLQSPVATSEGNHV